MQKDTSSRSGQANKATIYFIVGLVVVVTAAVIIAGIYSSGSSATNTASSTTTMTAPAVTASDWQEGNPNAKVTLVEYGDYECPACGAYYPVVQQLYSNFSSTVLFVFRNFPLYTLHPLAQIGAQAAGAAGLEGGQTAYWKMHDLLYANQTQWTANTSLAPAQVVSQYFNSYAQSIGLNVSTFDNDINATSVAQRIQNDVNDGNTMGIDATPTFFINQQSITNPGSYDAFAAMLSAAVASSTGSTPAPQPSVNVTSSNGSVGVSGIIVTTSTSAK